MVGSNSGRRISFLIPHPRVRPRRREVGALAGGKGLRSGGVFSDCSRPELSTSTVTAGLPCRVPPIACNISSSLAAYRERMRLSTSAASPAFGLNKRLADFVDRNEISSDRQNKDRSLGESRLAPFFRDGLEVDPQDVVGREVNPRVPVAALHRQLLRNAYPSGICRGRCCDNKAGTYPAGPGGGKGESPSLPER
jgi:hypothetical protein